MGDKIFPQGFLWGAATSSYQVEGDNCHCDWWAWEEGAGKAPSKDACQHYTRFNDDFDIAKSLNHNAHRFSIEWSRVEPREGEFDQEAIEHYKQVIAALRLRGIEPIVTLHHFTTPQWATVDGGWADRRIIKRFLNFVKVIVPAIASQVHWLNTINEPTIYFSHSFLWGVWPPQAKSWLKTLAVHDHMIEAHIQAYALINQLYREQNLLKPQISIAQHVSAVVPCEDTLRNRLAVKIRDKIGNFDVLDKMHQVKALDYIGVNYYSRQLVHTTSWWLGNIFMETCQQGHHPCAKNSLGWDIYPEGVYTVLTKLSKRYQLPLMITENGICTLDDKERSRFIVDHLAQVHRAISDGAKVLGYLHWSLLDNFEWDKGYVPRFGLVEVDYQTQTRRVRESAKLYAKICATNALW